MFALLAAVVALAVAAAALLAIMLLPTLLPLFLPARPPACLRMLCCAEVCATAVMHAGFIWCPLELVALSG